MGLLWWAANSLLVGRKHLFLPQVAWRSSYSHICCMSSFVPGIWMACGAQVAAPAHGCHAREGIRPSQHISNSSSIARQVPAAATSVASSSSSRRARGPSKGRQSASGSPATNRAGQSTPVWTCGRQRSSARWQWSCWWWHSWCGSRCGWRGASAAAEPAT